MSRVAGLSVGGGTLCPLSMTLEDHSSLKLRLVPPSYNCGWKHRLPTSRMQKLFTGFTHSMQHCFRAGFLKARRDSQIFWISASMEGKRPVIQKQLRC